MPTPRVRARPITMRVRGWWRREPRFGMRF
jgi:hypothetical protein